MVGLSLMWVKVPFPVFLLTLQDEKIPPLGAYVHPVVLCAVLAAGALILLVPRKHVVVPLLAEGLIIPFDQVVLIGPL